MSLAHRHIRPDRAAAALAPGELPEVDPAGLRVGALVARPGKVVCVGLNYRDQAAETGAVVPERPVVFMKDPATVVGPYDQVLMPRGSVKTDWDVELAVVIGGVRGSSAMVQAVSRWSWSG